MRVRLSRGPEVSTAEFTLSPSEQPVRRYRYYDLVLAGFVAVLLCSNLIGTAKVSEVALPIVGGVFVFGVGNIFFPISYIFGDVLTEVYGYARARRVIWAGFMAMVFASVMAWVVVNLPASPTEPFNATLQPAIEVVFGNTWRIAVASIVAFWVGDFVNAYVLARLKVATRGPLALDAHDRLDARGAGRRQRDLLSARVRRHLGRPDAARRHRVQLVLQGHGRGRHDAGDLCDRRLAQAPRARGLLRHGHELHALFFERLIPLKD